MVLSCTGTTTSGTLDDVNVPDFQDASQTCSGSPAPSALPSALPTTSDFPSAQPTSQLPVVEFTFDNPLNRMENTGIGDSVSSLDGILFPTDTNGISFPYQTENYSVASFAGTGCIQIPNSDAINTGAVADRTIELSFLWDGTNSTQVIYEQGGGGNGINIFLESNETLDTAMLVMAVWQVNQDPTYLAVVSTSEIVANRWYVATLVIDSILGVLQGYLYGVQFGEASVDFLPMQNHAGNICLGGTKQATLIIDSKSGNSTTIRGDGLYLYGSINYFRLFNSVQLISTSPSMFPSSQPTSPPPPANDLCINATEVELNSITSGSTVGATIPEGNLRCDDVVVAGPGVWYSFIGSGNHVIVSTCNAVTFGTKLSIYSGGCVNGQDDGAPVCIGSNNNADGCSGGSSKVQIGREDGAPLGRADGVSLAVGLAELLG